MALRYALFGIALVQDFSVFIARDILKDKEWCEPELPAAFANNLKEPIEL